MHWIKEVEMVESVDDLKSSCSVKGNWMPKIEVLDAKIASALNRIIHNTKFKRKVRLEEQKAQKEDRFLCGRQIAYLIYEYFQVTGANDSVENYADLFTISLRNDDIQEFDSKWGDILLSMTKIPPDDIWEGLYKLRMRESEKLKSVLELYDLEIHQKKAGPEIWLQHELSWMQISDDEHDGTCAHWRMSQEVGKLSGWRRRDNIQIESSELKVGWRVESNQQIHREVVTLCHTRRVELRAARLRQLQQVAHRQQVHQAVRQQLNDSAVLKFQIMVSRGYDGRLTFKARVNLVRVKSNTVKGWNDNQNSW